MASSVLDFKLILLFYNSFNLRFSTNTFSLEKRSPWVGGRLKEQIFPKKRQAQTSQIFQHISALTQILNT